VPTRERLTGAARSRFATSRKSGERARLRVAFVNQTGAKPGGAEESLRLFLENRPSDIEPIMLFFEDGEFAQRMRGYGLSTKIIGIPEHLRTATRERPFSMGALPLAGVINKVARFLATQRVDVVHTNTMKAHLIGAPAARLLGIPSVMHVRDMVEGLGRFALRAVSRTCTREQIAISQALSRWYGMSRTTVISNPVDLLHYDRIPKRVDARRTLGIPVDDAPLIGIVGRINRWKGHDRFLLAAAAVNARFPIRCAIVGEARFRDADFVPELHHLANDLGMADRTTFVPWLDDPKVAYAALDVHCNCSEREPFGRSIVEAAAAGVPTVAFDDGGAVDIIRDGEDGRIVAAGDTQAFAQALCSLLGDPERREQTGRNARLGSARFAAPEHARLVADVLRRTVM
jgi:glycosyltransferase involved in cell wall biosynthesis